MYRLSSFSLILFFSGLACIQACTDLTEYDRDRVEEAISDSMLSVTESWNIELDLIEKGHRKVNVVSLYAATYRRNGQTETELRDSVFVTVYDTTGSVATTVTSNSARYIGRNSEFQFKNDVVVNTGNGRRLYTDYLEWSRHDRSIYSPEFVILVTRSDSITGYGLEGTDDLVSYKLSEVTGEFELGQTFE